MSDRPKIEVFADFEPVMEAWRELEAVAPATIFQTERWLRPWAETVGTAHRITPMLIVARGPDGTPAALFPFGVSVAGGLRLAEFLGGRDSQANLPLFNPGAVFTRRFMTNTLSYAASTMLRPDAFSLTSQPYDWRGAANPMRLLPTRPGLNQLAAMHLRDDQHVLEQAAPAARERLQRAMQALGEGGKVTHLVGRDETSARRIMQAFFSHKDAHLAAAGAKVGFDNSIARGFFERVCLDGLEEGRAAMELHALCVNDRIVSTFGGGAHLGRFHAMIESAEIEPDIAACDPGDVLMAHMLEDLRGRGLHEIGIGMGVARRADVWRTRGEPLFDTLHGMTTAGRSFCFMEGHRRRIKRVIRFGRRVLGV